LRLWLVVLTLLAAALPARRGEPPRLAHDRGAAISSGVRDPSAPGALRSQPEQLVSTGLRQSGPGVDVGGGAAPTVVPSPRLGAASGRFLPGLHHQSDSPRLCERLPYDATAPPT
jgi:hypothetical protein